MEHILSKEEIRRKLKSNFILGLTEEQANERLKQYGKNKLADKKKEGIIIKFLKQFNDFMIIILIVASIISAVMAKIEGTGDYIESIIIIAIVVFNAIMGLVQENKAEKSLEALKKMSAPVTKVIRDGKEMIIQGEDVVIGDIVILEAGNYVPADCRLIESFNLKIDESALTGETVPVLKNADAETKEDTSIGDMVNQAFATTIVVNGTGKAIVTKTGMETKVGSIAKIIISDETPQTPIQKKLEEVGKILGIVCLIICFAIFIIGIFKKIPIKEMFLTSVGLAVAAIPEGLPAIVTIMLSIGVTKMAKRNSIIRKLAAVETLGSSSIICSDKTGTLTQNKMKILETYGDTEFVLELGCMCTDCTISKTKEVMGDPTEVAIVNKALEYGINKDKLYEKMPKINELPFDSDRKLMTTIHRIGDKYRIITKGAVDVLINKCTKIYQDGNIKNITNQDKEIISSKNDNMAYKALRVLGVAYLDVDFISNSKEPDTESIEKNLIFVGLVGMIDPPREGVKEAIRTCKKAGIKTVMITGDHITTATAIAKELGILRI